MSVARTLIRFSECVTKYQTVKRARGRSPYKREARACTNTSNMVRVPSRRTNPQTGAEEALCVYCGGVYLPLSNFYASTLAHRRRICKRCHNRMRLANRSRSVASTLLARVTRNEGRRGCKFESKHALEVSDMERILSIYGHNPHDPTTVRMTVTRLDRETPLDMENAIVLTQAEMRQEGCRPGSVLTPERVREARQRLWAARVDGHF